MCADIANFYINNPMNRYDYMKLPLDIIPEEIIQQYNLKNLAHKGFVYMEIQKGMYGIPQAAKISEVLLLDDFLWDNVQWWLNILIPVHVIVKIEVGYVCTHDFFISC